MASMHLLVSRVKVCAMQERMNKLLSPVASILIHRISTGKIHACSKETTSVIVCSSCLIYSALMCWQYPESQYTCRVLKLQRTHWHKLSESHVQTFKKKCVFLAVMSLTGALFLSHILVNNEINTNNDTVYMAIYGTNNYQIHIHTYMYSNIFLSIYIIPVQHHLENPELGSFWRVRAFRQPNRRCWQCLLWWYLCSRFLDTWRGPPKKTCLDKQQNTYSKYMYLNTPVECCGQSGWRKSAHRKVLLKKCGTPSNHPKTELKHDKVHGNGMLPLPTILTCTHCRIVRDDIGNLGGRSATKVQACNPSCLRGPSGVAAKMQLPYKIHRPLPSSSHLAWANSNAWAHPRSWTKKYIHISSPSRTGHPLKNQWITLYILHLIIFG